MNMPLPVRLGGVFIIFAAFPLLYNNCSEMKFEDGKVELATVTSYHNSSPLNPNADLPPGEADIYRPISDLENEPDLIAIYRCDTDSVSICHFPNNTDNAHTICIGFAAMDTHRAHEVQLTGVGDVAALSDYLGPCKH